MPYAIGCHPEKDADWYETARGLVGGDDFVETLPWARKLKALIDGGARIITLRMTRDTASRSFMTVRLIGHEESFEVRYSDGRPSKYYGMRKCAGACNGRS